MAQYTVYLKDLMAIPESMQAINTALSTYPLYAQQNKSIETIIPTREELNKRLLNAYRRYEIGLETPGEFIRELEITMNEIMPRYNELFKTIEIMAELESPFDNVDITEHYEETTDGKVNSSSNTDTITTSQDSSSTQATVNNGTKTTHTGTPQDDADILSIDAENINNVSYADEVTWNKSKNSDNATTSGNSSSTSDTMTTSGSTSQATVEHTFTKKGNQGVNTYAHDMIEFRTSIIDVTNQIINDIRIKELFMLVF